MSSRWCSKN